MACGRCGLTREQAKRLSAEDSAQSENNRYETLMQVVDLHDYTYLIYERDNSRNSARVTRLSHWGNIIINTTGTELASQTMITSKQMTNEMIVYGLNSLLMRDN
jgi:hypothetical protein